MMRGIIGVYLLSLILVGTLQCILCSVLQSRNSSEMTMDLVNLNETMSMEMESATMEMESGIEMVNMTDNNTNMTVTNKTMTDNKEMMEKLVTNTTNNTLSTSSPQLLLIGKNESGGPPQVWIAAEITNDNPQVLSNGVELSRLSVHPLQESESHLKEFVKKVELETSATFDDFNLNYDGVGNTNNNFGQQQQNIQNIQQYDTQNNFPPNFPTNNFPPFESFGPLPSPSQRENPTEAPSLWDDLRAAVSNGFSRMTEFFGVDGILGGDEDSGPPNSK